MTAPYCFIEIFSTPSSSETYACFESGMVAIVQNSEYRESPAIGFTSWEALIGEEEKEYYPCHATTWFPSWESVLEKYGEETLPANGYKCNLPHYLPTA